jgi:hypothetical protein
MQLFTLTDSPKEACQAIVDCYHNECWTPSKEEVTAGKKAEPA